MKQDIYGALDDGRLVKRYQLQGDNGFSCELIELGAAIVSLIAPDRTGHLADVVLGYEELGAYELDELYMGATIGRYCNRIARGRFELDGATHVLFKNDGVNHLHGGVAGFNRKHWTSEVLDERSVQFSYDSPHGEEGYPGELHASVIYTLLDPGEIHIRYEARADRPTVINLTNHSYFNLAGNGSVLDHYMQLESQRYAPVDKNLIPTGKLAPVEGTPLDFTHPRTIGEAIDLSDIQIQMAGGFDHSWALDSTGPAATVYDPGSGRLLRVFTDQPALHFYAGNYITQGTIGKANTHYGPHSGFCLETQHYANSPNISSFPSTRLDKAEFFESETRFQLSVSDQWPFEAYEHVKV